MGNKTNYEYFDVTNLIKEVTAPNDFKTSYTYDDYGRVISCKKDDALIIYNYGGNLGILNQIIVKKDGQQYGNHLVYNLSYDDYGRLTGLSIEDNAYINKTYKVGKINLTDKIEYNNGNTYLYLYDSNDRLTSIRYLEDDTQSYETIVTYSYDVNGRLIKRSDIYGDVVTEYNYYYDGSGNITRIENGDVLVESYKYDKFNNLSEKLYEFNNYQSKMIINYNYALSRVKNVQYRINNESDVINKTNNYGNNGPLKIDGYTVSYNSTDVYQKQYTYHNTNINSTNFKTTNFIKSEAILQGSNTLYSYSYQYDSMSNIKYIYNLDNSYVEYTYDKKNQLTKEFYFDNESVKYLV